MGKSTILEASGVLNLRLKHGQTITYYDRTSGRPLLVTVTTFSVRTDSRGGKHGQWTTEIHAPEWIGVDRKEAPRDECA